MVYNLVKIVLFEQKFSIKLFFEYNAYFLECAIIFLLA